MIDMPPDQLLDLNALEQAACDPHHRPERPEGSVGRVRVGRFRVVDPAHAVLDADEFDAVRIQPERGQHLADDAGLDTVRPGEGAGGEHVRHDMRRGKAGLTEVVECCELDRTGETVFEEGTVAEDAVDDPEIARTGHVETEADRARALDHLGLLDHQFGCAVGTVVDARHLGVVVHFRLRRAVGVERAVPVEVVVGDVQAGARERRELAPWVPVDPVQLVTGELHHQNVEPLRVADGVQHGDSDVPARRGAVSARSQHGRRELHRRRLAVRTGDRDPVRGLPDLVAQAPGELDIAPQRDGAQLRPAQQRVVVMEAR